MLWFILVFIILSTSTTIFSHQTALKQETLLMPFEDRVRESVGFGRYYVRTPEAEILHKPEDDDDTPMKQVLGYDAINGVEANHAERHRKPRKLFNKLSKWHKKYHKKTSDKRTMPLDWRNEHSRKWRNEHSRKWRNEAIDPHSSLNDSKKNPLNKEPTEDVKPDNIPHCFECGASDNIDSIEIDKSQSLTNQFVFHKVNVETSYDPFTKRPYHKTIIAMRALPDNIRKQSSEDQNHNIRHHFQSPHYYYMFFNSSANQSLQKVTKIPTTESPDYLDSFLYSEQPKKPHKSRSIKKIQYKYPPSVGSRGRAADYYSEDARFKKTSMDSLWISSYLENPSKFDSLTKQLRFLKRWMVKLERHYRKKIRRNESI